LCREITAICRKKHAESINLLFGGKNAVCIYLEPSNYFIYQQVPRLEFYMLPRGCIFVLYMILQQPVIISLHSNTCSFFITRTGGVNRAVRTGPLNRISLIFSPRRTVFDPSSVRRTFVVDNVTMRQGFLRVLLFSRVRIISTMIQIHFHIKVVLTTRTDGRSLGTFQHARLFRDPESFG